MGTDSTKYNNEKNMSINIELNKTCYFPGETITGTITLYPFIQSFEKIMDNPSFNIAINQFQHYSYSTGSGKKRHTVVRNEEKNLITTTINFQDKIKTDYSSGFAVPFSVQVPENAYPSVSAINAYVKHLFIVDLPHTETKRTVVFIIKGIFPNNLDGNLLIQNVEEAKEFKKANFLVKKGSCLLALRCPKNYFYYDEKIPFQLSLDCTKLEMNIKSIGVILERRVHKNLYSDHSKPIRTSCDIIEKKIFNLEKNLSRYDISDCLTFPTTSLDGNWVYPPNVYQQLDEKGVFEINSNFSYRLYPCCIMGLVSVKYFIKVELYFDCTFTFDEELAIPLYFGPNFENNPEMKNQGYYNSIPGVCSQCTFLDNNTIGSTLYDSVNTTNTLNPQ